MASDLQVYWQWAFICSCGPLAAVYMFIFYKEYRGEKKPFALAFAGLLAVANICAITAKMLLIKSDADFDENVV